MSQKTRVPVIEEDQFYTITLPKEVLAQAGINDEVDLIVREGEIIIRRPGFHPRQGWAEQLKRMAEENNGESSL